MSGRRRGKPWCKLWVDAIRTPKVANLSNDQFRWWVTLLAIATRFDGEGQGLLPDIESVAQIVSQDAGRPKRPEEVQAAVDCLVRRKLIDCDSPGVYRMHDYAAWQAGDVPSALPVPAKARTTTPRKTPDSELAPDGERELSPIQLVVAGYCDAVDIDPRELGPAYGRYSRTLMGLAQAGYTREDARRLTQFVATSDYWRGNRTTPPPESVVSQVGAWKASGKPDTWRPGMRQVTNGRGSIVAAAARIGEQA